MSHYTNPSINFKLAHETSPMSKRAIRIWNLILNRLGIPETLHEPVAAIFVSANWEEVNYFVPITVFKMAQNLGSNNSDYQRLYNRLKKSLPKFFEWQEQQEFRIIDREIIVERAQKYKTKAQYHFLIYDKVSQLLDLPPEMTLNQVREAVDKAFSDLPVVPPLPKKKKRKRPETEANSIIASITNLKEITGTYLAAAIYTIDANPEHDKIHPFAEAVSQILRGNENTFLPDNSNEINK